MKINLKICDKKFNIKKSDKQIEENKIVNENFVKKYESNKKIKDKTSNYKIKYYTLFLCMVLLSTVSIKNNIKLNKKLEEETYLVFNSEENIDYQDNLTNNRDTRFLDSERVINNTFNYNKNKIKYENDKNISNINNNFIKELKFIKPLNGKIIKNYSEDLVYSKTLDMWKNHDGIDIKGDLNENVIAVEDGIIERKFEDSFYGNTLIIKHKNGYKSIYCNVTSNLKINDNVIKYQKIGKIDNSSIGEYKDDYHLHFMMKYNDEIINPNIKIKF